MASAKDRATGGEEGMRLVERVGDDVQEGERPEAEAALQQHEAHLRDRRPGQRRLGCALGEHHHRAEEGGEAAEHDEGRHAARARLHQFGEADHQEAAGIDDAGMEEGRDRGRGLHHLGDPAVQREGGGLESRHHHQQGDGNVGREGQATLRGRANGAEVGGAEADPEEGRGEDQQHVAAEPDEGELGGGALRLRPLAVEHQEPPEAGADRDEARGEHDQAAGLDEQQYRRQRPQHQAVEPALLLLTVEIGAGVAHHDPADEADQHRHGRAHRVQPQREKGGAGADGGHPLAEDEELDERGEREAEGGERCSLGKGRIGAGAASGPHQREGGGAEKHQRCELHEGDEGRHGDSGDQRLPPEIRLA